MRSTTGPTRISRSVEFTYGTNSSRLSPTMRQRQHALQQRDGGDAARIRLGSLSYEVSTRSENSEGRQEDRRA